MIFADGPTAKATDAVFVCRAWPCNKPYAFHVSKQDDLRAIVFNGLAEFWEYHKGLCISISRIRSIPGFIHTNNKADIMRCGGLGVVQYLNVSVSFELYRSLGWGNGRAFRHA